MKPKFHIILAGLFFTTVQLKAQAPNAINYQGVARNSSGTVIATKSIGLEFTILQGSSTGTIVYQETQTDSTNQFGLFTAAIGAGTAVGNYDFSNINWGAGNEYLQVEMDPTGGKNYINMGTQQLLSVPYALYAAHSGSPWVTSGKNIYNSNSGSVGIGTTTPAMTDQLDVATNHSVAGYFETDSLYFNVYGVMGVATPADETGYGGYFTSHYIGSKSYSEGKTASGLYIGGYDEAVSTTSSSTYGNVGIGFAMNGTPIGIYGSSQDSGSGTAYGVYGNASSATGVAYGLYGEGAPTGGYAFANGNGVTNSYLDSIAYTDTHVIGFDGEVTGTAGSNITTENDGVLAVATNTDGFVNMGTFSYATGAQYSNYGNYSVAQATPASYYTFDIYTDLNPTGDTSQYGNYAAYFNSNSNEANVFVDGMFTALAKQFKIDDPLDPANKYLYHNCVESPDMMNIYNGDITTDGNGNATVALPPYFQAENKDYKYQLTVIGQFAQAIVLTKINNNQFTIKTDKPNVEVSWQVTGVRNDPFATAHNTEAEVEKKGIEKGHYLCPQYYGQPQTMSIGYLMSAVNKNKTSSSSVTVHNPVAPPQLPTTSDNVTATQLH